MGAGHERELVLFQVTDSGIGVPEGQHDKIFEMFRQADSSITRSFWRNRSRSIAGEAVHRDAWRKDMGGKPGRERSFV